MEQKQFVVGFFLANNDGFRGAKTEFYPSFENKMGEILFDSRKKVFHRLICRVGVIYVLILA